MTAPSAPSAPSELVVIRRIWRYCSPYRRRLLGLAALELVAAMLGAVPPVLLMVVIDRGLAQSDRGLVTGCAVVMAAAAAGWCLVRWVASRGEARLFAEFHCELRTTLFEHFQQQGFGFFTVSRPGALTSSIMSDAASAAQAINVLTMICRHGGLVVVSIGTMAAIDWRTLLVVVAVLPPLLIPVRWLAGRVQTTTDAVLSRRRDLSSQAVEALSVQGAELLKVHGAQLHVEREFYRRATRLRDAEFERNIVGLFFPISVGTTVAMGGALVVGLAALTAPSGAISAGAVAANVTYLSRMQEPVNILGLVASTASEAVAAFRRVFEVLDFDGSRTPANGHALPLRLNGRNGRSRRSLVTIPVPVGVRFEGVSFRYPEPSSLSVPLLCAPDIGPDPPVARPGSDALVEVSFSIEAGSCVAMVGPSGSGKTTIALLLSRLYMPDRGRILLNGTDLADVPESELRRRVAVVTQTPRLFNASIAENLRLGRSVSDDELRRACQMAQIHERIEALPHRYDTVLGESGEQLSGGERQRVAIARALVGDPAVVVFDEATAHLDRDAETRVLEAIQRAMVGRTCLFITHRASTALMAGNVLVVDRGQVLHLRHPSEHELLQGVGG